MIGTQVSISQAELEQLLRESQDIATNWNTYIQFQQNREAMLKAYLPKEGLN